MIRYLGMVWQWQWWLVMWLAAIGYHIKIVHRWTHSAMHCLAYSLISTQRSISMSNVWQSILGPSNGHIFCSRHAASHNKHCYLSREVVTKVVEAESQVRQSSCESRNDWRDLVENGQSIGSTTSYKTHQSVRQWIIYFDAHTRHWWKRKKIL